MPETDILNPFRGLDPDLGDSMNPSFGIARGRSAAPLKRAIGGRPWSREVDASGHKFSLSWVGRSRACMKRLKRYWEQYRSNGYFTLIDWDNDRHYVGRFTGDWPDTHPSNGRWSVENLVFEEIPTAPMVRYPDDWDHDAITITALDDWGDRIVASSGTWSLVDISTDLVDLHMLYSSGTAGDWAQLQYHGYGFRLSLLQSSSYGQCQVLLDGNVITPDDASSTTIDCYSSSDLGPQMLCAKVAVPLGFHRVKVLSLGAKNDSSSGLAIGFCSIEVMR